MPSTIYQYAVDFAGTQFATDLICRGLAAQDEPTNYDIAGYVQQATIVRGRDREVQAGGQAPFSPGRLSLVLNNTDMRFSPDDETNPPYTGWDVGLMVQVRAYAMALGGLVSWWDFEDALYDSYGANYLTNGSLNQVTFSNGPLGRQVDFNGLSSYLTIASNVTLQMSGNASFTIGFGILAGATTNQTIISKWESISGNNREYRFVYDLSISRWRFQVSSNGTSITNVTANTFGAPTDGTYHFIVIWYDGATINVQVDNGGIDSTAFTGGVFSSSSAFLLGAQDPSAPTLFASGSLDTLFVTKRALTPDERTALYNNGNGKVLTTVPSRSIVYPGIATNLFTGFIDTIIPQPDDEQQSVTVECTDLLARMGLISNVYSGMWAGLGTGALVQRLLSDGMQWRLDWASIDAGDDTVSYAWWAAANLLQAIQSIERSEYGQFFVDGNGYPAFHSRTYRQTSAAAGGGTAIGDASVQSLELRRELGEVYNFVQVQAHPRVVYKTGVQVWSSRQSIALIAGSSVNLIANFSDPDTQKQAPALNVIPPVATVDYSANDLSNGGQVTSVAVNAAGSGYDVNNPPIVGLQGGGGYGATVTATVATGSVSSAVVTSSGSGYTSAPTVTFSGGGGQGAAGYAVVNLASGAVTNVNITNGGTGYTSAPTIAFSGGGGSGAAATAYADVNGRIVSYTVTNGGGGYTSAPTVTVTGSGTGATATATVTVGTDRTSSLNVTANFASFGQSAFITIRNTSVGTIYVPYFRLRGDPLMEPDTTPAFAQSALSQSKYLLRAMLLDQPWQKSTANAQALASSLVLRYSNPQTRFTPHLANVSASDLRIMLNMELDDVVDGTFGRAGLTAAKTFFAGRMEHTISDYGLLHQLALGLEASRLELSGVYDTSQWDLSLYT